MTLKNWAQVFGLKMPFRARPSRSEAEFGSINEARSFRRGLWDAMRSIFLMLEGTLLDTLDWRTPSKQLALKTLALFPPLPPTTGPSLEHPV